MNRQNAASNARAPRKRPSRPLDADDILLAAFEGGDDDAFKTLFFRYRDRLVSIAHFLCGDFETGEELVRRGMIRVFKAGRSRRGGLTVRHRLMRETVRRATRHERRRALLGLFGLHAKIKPRRILPVHRLEFRIRGPEHARRRIVIKALAGLPRKLREVLVLCDFEGLTYEEAASVLHLRSRTVGIRVGRGRLLFSALFQRMSRR